ncbi:thiol peroxidase [Lentibacillus saliphilus]|uniref:thiol peroxidase n=1 Tax=Lentibacillus saliphilus TaxID=2737028 RepID=UPI001C30057C|nr:thiol peroxidase [Lentibacillus saliphilus]
MPRVTFNHEPITLVGQELTVGEQAPDFQVVSNELKGVSLNDYKGKIKLIATVPSVDTGVCAEETKRFNEEASKLDNVEVLTISMDLPFAQARWKASNDIKHLDLLSDHKSGDFGEKYGVLIKDLRLLARAVFVVGSDDKISYVEYVDEVTNHPDYEAALQAAKTSQ